MMAREHYERRIQYKKYKRYMKRMKQEKMAPPQKESQREAKAGPSAITPEPKKTFAPLPQLDAGKRADFVLVYSQSKLENQEDKLNIISTFVKNIKQTGLEVEEQTGLLLDDLVGFQITASSSVLAKHTAQFRIELTRDNPYYQYPEDLIFKFMTNVATNPRKDDPIVQRAPETLSGERPKNYTNAERILIVDRILNQTKYGDDKGETGYQRLVDKGILLAAYPLHDSLYEWTEDGPLTDRQLLAKYWASIKCLFKEQPLSLIDKYYGPEVGFYFAWLGSYTKLLVLPAIIGLVCFLIGLIYYFYEKQYIEKEVCESDRLLCPVCPSQEKCSFVPIKGACDMMKFGHILENPVTIIYSCLMCFWGVVFMLFWKREQSVLRLRWNLQGVDVTVDRSVRPEYIRIANLKNALPATEEKIYYVPFFKKMLGLGVGFLSILIILFIYCLAIAVVIYIRLCLNYYGRRSSNEKLKKNLVTIISMTSAFLTCSIIMVFDFFKKVICKKLTEWENPRTQRAFRRRYTIKLSIFSLANILLPMAYIAFFKGHFYTHPGDPSQWRLLGLFKSDVCSIGGCLVDLSMQLIFIIVFRNAMRLFQEWIIPAFMVLVGKAKTGGFGFQWEEDFILMNNSEDYIYSEYILMVIQYSYMTFFVVSLPFAPFLVLINNIIEIRIDAWKLLRKYKRTVPKQVAGIEEWNIILHIITILGAISNPLLIAFNSNFISKYIYTSRHPDLTGFINSTLSEFSVSDYPGYERQNMATETCHYYGMRYPPTHPERYDLTLEYWYQFAMKAIFFIILENICLLLSLFLGYIIPEVPRKIQIQLDNDQITLQRLRTMTPLPYKS